MDYRKMIAALAVATTTVAMADGIVSSSVVGYQNKGFDRSGYNISAISFETIGVARDAITLGDITPSDDFSNSFITFMTAGGATAKVDFNGKQVAAKYFYWTEDDAEDGAGWYLQADEDAEYNQNSVELQAGEGFLVNRAAGEASATLTIPSAL